MMPTTWIGLLRGVNVGGNTIRSADLVEAIRAGGFARVKTVLASGNVLVEDGDDARPADIRRRLEAAIDERYGYGVAVAVVRLDEMRAIIDAYPFDEVAEKHPHVTFATEPALIDALAAEASAVVGDADATGAEETGERVAMGDGVIYWEVARGSSTDSPFARVCSRARYRSGPEAITTRNLRTLRKLDW